MGADIPRKNQERMLSQMLEERESRMSYSNDARSVIHTMRIAACSLSQEIG